MYKLSLLLHKTYNETIPGIEWINFATQIIVTGRQKFFEIAKTNNTKIGLNTSCNKFYCLNKEIDLTLLDLSYVALKENEN